MNRGLRALATSLRLTTSDPRTLASLLRLRSFVTSRPFSSRQASISRWSTVFLGRVGLLDFDVDLGVLLEPLAGRRAPRRPRLRRILSWLSAMSWTSWRMNCGTMNWASRTFVSMTSAIRPSIRGAAVENERPPPLELPRELDIRDHEPELVLGLQQERRAEVRGA